MLKLPRKQDGKYYLSYSQIALWKKSKRNYIRQYFLGEKEDNQRLQKYADFGHKVGEAFENNDFSAFSPEEQEFLKTVPRFDEFEREVVLQMDGFFMKGYIDTNTLSEGIIEKLADYKTGEIEKVRPKYESKEYIQTEIYSAAVEQETGKLPKEVSVIIIQRNGNAFSGEELTLGREFHIVKKKVTKARVKEVLKEIQDIAEEISSYYQVFLELNQ